VRCLEWHLLRGPVCLIIMRMKAFVVGSHGGGKSETGMGGVDGNAGKREVGRENIQANCLHCFGIGR
jgi:hypothetical protein